MVVSSLTFLGQFTNQFIRYLSTCPTCPTCKELLPSLKTYPSNHGEGREHSSLRTCALLLVKTPYTDI